MTIKGEAADDAATYAGTATNISTRSLTTASAAWNPGAWGTASERHDTTDLSAVVQEIVNRSGWNSGNALAFVVDGVSGGRVSAESYDGDIDPGLAARLFVRYVPVPAISVSGTPLVPFSSDVGVVSAVQSYSVGGRI